MMRLVRRYLLEASTNNFMEAHDRTAGRRAAGAKPAKDSGRSPTRHSRFDQEYWRAFRTDLGSNALALGSDATDNGRGLLLGNPHFPWIGTLRFYQFHVTIPDEIDVMGGALSGFPLVNIGFNKDVAWSHTNDTPNWHFTLYQLKLDPANPTQVRLRRPVARHDDEDRERPGEERGRHARRPSRTRLYLSHFGPLTTSTLAAASRGRARTPTPSAR